MRDAVRRGRVARAILGGTMCVEVLTACSRLTKVSAPDIVQPAAFENPAGAQTRRAGALGQFYVDVSAWASLSGELADEFTQAFGGGGLDRSGTDLRILPDGGHLSAAPIGTYPGPQSRVNLLTAVGLLQRYSPAPPSAIGELFAALGTIETIMAEDMCSGVPIATVVGGLPVAGQPVTSAALYAHALAQFDSAAHYASDSSRISSWVAIGRARALTDLDSLPAAVAAVAGVSTAYLSRALYSTATSEQNAAAVDLDIGNMAVSNREGVNGLDFVTAGDPRVPIVDSGLGGDHVTERYVFVPYTSVSAPLTIASGVEARLIEAEAALRSGNVGGWAADLNALRADSAETGVAGLPPLTADSTTGASPAIQVNVMFRERAFWLFATGHRQGDLRRLIRQYGRTQNQVFPIGSYKNTGQQYGSDVTFPIVGDNPDVTVPECLSRDP